MNDKKKSLWDNSLDNISEKHTAEAAETIYKKSVSETDSDELVVVEGGQQKRGIYTFAIAACLTVLVGVVVLASVLLTNGGIEIQPTDSDTSSVSIEENSEENSEGESSSLSQTESVITSAPETTTTDPMLESIIEPDTDNSVTESFDGVYDETICLFDDYLFFKIQPDNTLTLVSYESTNPQLVIFPERVADMPVTGISAHAFDKSRSFIELVLLPNSITTIEDGAFADCTMLEEIIIPDGVTEIRENTFKGCSSMKSAYLPAKLKYIHASAFEGCSSLLNLELPEGLEKIGSNAFSGCETLMELNLPASVSNIYGSAFSGCTSLRTVTLKKKGSLNPPLYISENAFANCSSLVTFTMSNGVKYVGASAFSGCSALTSMNLSNDLLKIGNEAFANCTALRKLLVPFGVSEIGENAFSGCTALTLECYALSCAEKYAKENNIPTAKAMGSTTNRTYLFEEIEYREFTDSQIEITGYVGNKEELVIPDMIDGKRVHVIANNAFDNTSVTSVILPYCVGEIRNEAFKDNKTLKKIVLPEGLFWIGERAFEGCTALETIKIPEVVTNLESGADRKSVV